MIPVKKIELYYINAGLPPGCDKLKFFINATTC